MPLNQYQEGIIAGWRPGAGRRVGTIGSLLLAAHGADGNLDFIGSVGTGFTDRMLEDLLWQLGAIEFRTGDRPPSPT